MPNWLKKRAELTPGRTALTFGDESWTFAELYKVSLGIAKKLGSLGAVNRTRIAVLLPNKAESVFILHALQMAGCETVILNNRLTADELAWQLEDSSPKIFIAETFLYDKAKEAFRKAEVPEGKLLCTEEIAFLEAAGPYSLLKEYSLDDVTTIMYTSGTTGKPKGVLQTYGNHWWSATGSALNIGIYEQDKWLCAVPIFHISGYSILMRSIIYGITVELHEHFNAAAVIESFQTKRVTIMSVVATMLSQIVEKMDDRGMPESFRCMLLGGGPAPLSLLETCRSKGVPVYQTYGMTETSSQFATLPPEYSIEKLGSAGKALFPNQIRVLLEDGTDAHPYAEGEIVVKGPNVTPGYANRDQETANALKEGWLYTGDIGYLDDSGFLFVLDRRSDLIISGGENIYPAEIEGILQAHPKISDAGIAGVQDAKWGEAPAAFIVKKQSSDLTEQEVLDYCENHLAKYKIPKHIIFVESIPRNAAKKLLRRKLKAMLKGEDGLE
ncbi:o-succinylbenzoate--CoA ligase [Bacillus massilinigeriensis]|uniref:o-succinylbenzoate--CoA ligase n=1 Tax=Bacillus mediterraneensis TaxID=1805474 RepID=UPI0008F95DC9